MFNGTFSVRSALSALIRLEAQKMQTSLGLRYIAQRTTGRFLNSSLPRPRDVIDPVQETALKERCFLVDANDKVIGTATKRECHTVSKQGIPLHRAFSVFLFNKKGDLLLQKRADTKVLYPGCYSFSCTGHPCPDLILETDETNAAGVKEAAKRKLNQDLGIDRKSINVEDMAYLTRIYHYDRGDGVWGNHEIVYVIFMQTDVKMKPNPDELSEISLIPLEEFNSTLKALEPTTPLFQLVVKHRLKLWWKNLDDLSKFVDHETVQTFE